MGSTAKKKPFTSAIEEKQKSSGRRKKARRGIQSADKAAEVLMALVEAGQPAPLRDLARAIDMPTSLAHRYLASLVTSGLAVQNNVTGLYDLGPSAIRIGAAALARVDPLRLASEAMPELVAKTGLTALLNVLGDRGPTIVRWERSYVPFITTLAVGSVLPLTGSASGRVILAFTPDRIRRKLMQLKAPKNEDEAPAKLSERFIQIRKRGFDTADSTVVPGLSAVSTPILDLQNEAVASLTLVGSRSDMVHAGSQAVAALLETACGVSQACGSSLKFS
ncbi:IclR family transcriptional regulator [Bradyrhizobium sp.]|jgi:DNA-binding IclR family transcriptional regulator|uniref:IclR family transcriptional regulator n=1 Tax=Bradyrhizobium sp. TaxID=376 RepID=UPI003BB191EB